ncbi:hypothetical protein CCACVL1_14963 [Corchorus capsularis]|uniref:Pentatricopeptide repeat-containing protein n=1 Tax=Corchorus capsularis TaxID=210143 RepID=A0A1R3I4R6_COCAP|nr:hypothetical protein CCACVL1_14963 [Corchorus capsularis]
MSHPPKRKMFSLLSRYTPPYSKIPLNMPKPFSTTTPPPQNISIVTTLTNLILTSTDAQSLTQALLSPSINWTPHLVNTILKHLWNHGPKALQFFHLLRNHPTYIHSPSSFDHAIDIAARLRNYNTISTLLHSMRTLRLHPSPKTFAIIAERGD